MTLSKYSASGNDFVIFHTFRKKNRSELAKKLCHRQEGIGADGLIVLIPKSSSDNDYDFEWQFYNSDGSVAEMCGNGSRACAHYAFSNDLASENMSFLTVAGVIKAEVEPIGTNNGMVLSELTPPEILDKNIEYNGKKWWKINTGVPHLVQITNNIEEFDIAEARELRYKYNANINIVFIDGANLRVRTYERGVEDETLACGTGMAASFYMAYTQGLVTNDIEVYPASGETLYLGMNEKTITFRGEVKKIFVTEI